MSTRPWRAAKTRACSRECTPSLWRMFTMWVRSVSTVMFNFSAISLLSRPSPRAWRISLPGGDLLDGLQRLPLLLTLAADHAQHLDDLARREQRLPGLEPPDRPDYVLYGGGLVQHAAGAGLDRAGKPPRFQARAEDQRHYLRFVRGEILDQLETVPVGEGEIYDRDLHVSQQPIGELAYLAHRADLADHLELGFPLEHKGQGLAERNVVLDEQNPGQIVLDGSRPY